MPSKSDGDKGKNALGAVKYDDVTAGFMSIPKPNI
jgi:hypothetical protein